MNYKNFVYYQPNNRDLKDLYGDCVVRALSKALNASWIDTFRMLVEVCFAEQCLPDEKVAYETLLKNQGFKYQGISNRRGSKRPTVREFAKKEKRPCVMVTAHHLVASVDGKYYDTWDCGHKCLYGYWVKEGV